MMFKDSRTIQNNSDAPLVVWLEPWASEYVLAPGQSLVAIGISEKEGQFDVAEYSGKIGIYIWPGSSVQIFQDGKLIDDFPLLFDDIPPSGMTLRGFIEEFFGGPGETGGAKPRLRWYSFRWGVLFWIAILLFVVWFVQF
jgi:hypothetical protein